jgi:hypothetical protein
VAHIFQTEVKQDFILDGGRSKGIWEQSASNCKPKFDLKKAKPYWNTRRTTKPFFKLKGISEK